MHLLHERDAAAVILHRCLPPGHPAGRRPPTAQPGRARQTQGCGRQPLAPGAADVRAFGDQSIGGL